MVQTTHVWAKVEPDDHFQCQVAKLVSAASGELVWAAGWSSVRGPR